jgi:hypothetical protein
MSPASTFPDIFARLAVVVEGHDFSVQAADGEILIELPDLRAGWALLRMWPIRRKRAKIIELVQAVLTTCGLRLEFRLADTTIAVPGTGVRRSLISRVFGLKPLELRPLQMLLAIINV